jgi:hypothetical protein
MKFVITDENNKEVLSTISGTEAYSKLKELVYDPQTLLSLSKIKNAINYDKNAGKPQSCFGFHADEEQKKYISLDVFWDE